MNRKRTLVFGVVYPGVEDYIDDYAESINDQDYQEFDILIIDDGLHIDLTKKFNKDIDIIFSENKYSKAEIRQLSIDYAIQKGYRNIVFTDTDDFFSRDRIANAVKMLNSYDFVINELVVTDNGGHIAEYQIWDKFINQKNLVIDSFLDSNIFGLSNSAVRTSLLKQILLPDEIIASDWIIVSQLLLAGAEGIISDSKTYHRQTENNDVGIRFQLTPNRLRKGILAKRLHYQSMCQICKSSGVPEYIEQYLEKFNQMKELADNITDSGFENNYIDAVNRNFETIYTGWWSEILPLEQWRKYAQ